MTKRRNYNEGKKLSPESFSGLFLSKFAVSVVQCINFSKILIIVFCLYLDASFIFFVSYSNDKKQSKYDIAIVKLNKEWKKSPSLRMCEPNENSGIRPLTVLGMGTTVPGLGKHKTPTYLQETFQEEVEAYPDKFCGKQPIPYVRVHT